MDFASFATPDAPLRMSHVGRFLECPWSEVMLVIGGAGGRAGEAADTGSATHTAVAHWHRTGDAAGAVAAMREGLPAYPAADMKLAASLFLAYTLDPGNVGCELVLVEHELTVDLAPHPSDPTGAPVRLLGHVDQVRRVRGRLEVWDLKTTSKPPYDALCSSQHQAAAYCLGAAALLGEPVHPGGLVLPRRQPMHVPFVWGLHDVPYILAPLVAAVAAVRRGDVHHSPGVPRCNWCHANGPDACLPLLRLEVRRP